MSTKRLNDGAVAARCLQVDLEKEIAIEAHRVVVFVGKLRVGGWAGGCQSHPNQR